MRRPVFLRIMKVGEEYDDYFMHKRNVAYVLGVSLSVKSYYGFS
jgi:hypothetical protein